MTAAAAELEPKGRMPKKKTSSGKAVIPTCPCGSTVYGCAPLVTTSGAVAGDWYLLTCSQCGTRRNEKFHPVFPKEKDE